MKKLLILLFSIISIGVFGQTTDAALTTQSNVIRNESTPGGNTKGRIADMFQGLIDSKVSLLGAYNNPSWITGLGWSKITGAPSFLTSEGDPVYLASSWYSTTNNSTNWNTAYGWGNHAGLYLPLTLGGNTTLNGPSYSLSFNLNSFNISTTSQKWTINGSAGTSGQVLGSDGAGNVTWVTPSGGGLSDGDKGDITVSGSGTVWNIDAATVGVTELSATGTPSASTYLRGDNTWATVSGSGDVVGPASAVNNNVVFFDGITGKLIKDSGLTLSGSNSGDVSLAGTPNYITIAGQTITRSLIDLTSHVTGKLPFANIADVGTGTVMYRKTAGTGSMESQTLATLKTDLGLTGTNSGDQTSIVGITGTKTQFNTAVTDGDIQFVGDAPTAHTLDSHSNVTITANTSGELLKWNGTAWINNTLAEAGIQPAGTYATGTGSASGTNTGDQTITNTSDATSHTATLSATGGSIKLVEGSNITLTTTGTGSDGIVTIAAAGGGGATNLAWDAPTRTVSSDTGTDAVITLADATNAGLMSSADKIRFDAMEAINVQSGTTYTLLSSDRGKMIYFTNASPITVTLPNGLATDFTCSIIKAGTGTITLTPTTGSLHSTATTIEQQWTGATVQHEGSNQWSAFGALGTPITPGSGLTLNSSGLRLGGTLSVNTDIDTDGMFTLKMGQVNSSPNDIYLASHDTGGGTGIVSNYQSLKMYAGDLADAFIYTDARTTKEGIKYAADGYVTQPGSLTDKRYVDGKLASKTIVAPTVTEDTKSIRWNNTGNTWEYFTPGTGTGDVTGQASSIDSEIALFSGTTGKVIKRATTTGILKGTSGVLSAAVSGTDYAPATSGSAILKGNGAGGFSSAVAGTDYVAPDQQLTDVAALSYVGNGGKFMRVNAGETAFELATVSGSGDVTGPASSVDNTIARFDLTTGKIIQGSEFILGDNASSFSMGTTSSTGTSRTIEALGSGADIGISINTKGLGAFQTNSSQSILNGTSSTIWNASTYSGSALTNALNYFQITNATTGTPATGIGTGLLFKVKTDAANNYENAAKLDVTSTDLTGASEDFDLSIKTMTAGAETEKIGIKSTGDIAINGSVGTTGQFLKSNGTGAAAAWATLPSPVLSKTLTLYNPGASENISLFYTDVAITVTKVADAIQGTTSSIDYQVNHASTRNNGTPNTLFSTARTLNSPSGVTTTTFNDATIPAGSWVWFTTSAASGTITDVSITLVYTND